MSICRLSLRRRPNLRPITRDLSGEWYHPRRPFWSFTRLLAPWQRSPRGGLGMNALVVKHIDCEGPGTLADAFARHGMAVTVACPYRGETLPDVERFDAVVVLGGPMGVYERDRYSFIDREAALVRAAVSRDVPTLGICLGSQIIADALGGVVTRHSVKEIGAMTVTLTDHGLTDPLFEGLTPSVSVFQWHGDTFSIPPGGVRLASSAATANQAFRYGRCAYGLQFHVEVTPAMVGEWLGEYADEVVREGLDAERVRHDAERQAKSWRGVAGTDLHSLLAPRPAV